MAHDRQEDYLISPARLERQLGDPGLRILDARTVICAPGSPRPYVADHAAYLAAHVPGAGFLDWAVDIVDRRASPRSMAVAGPGKLRLALGRLGVGNQHRVVIYDDGRYMAARLWWVLKRYGHRQTVVLDGGWPRWRAEGRPVTSAIPTFATEAFTPAPDGDFLVEAAGVRDLLGAPDATLVDCRDPEIFRGLRTTGRRLGRIPGAINVPWNHFLDQHGRWLSTRETMAMVREAGLRPEQRIIAYCNAGVVACTAVLGLRRLGFPRVANYAGSWYEWERNRENPVER